MAVPHYIHSSTVEMWRLHITATIPLYRCGGSILQPHYIHIFIHSSTVEEWRFHITSTVPIYTCGGSTLHPQFPCRDVEVTHYIHSSTVEMWKFHITSTVSLYMLRFRITFTVLMYICGGFTLHPQFHC